MTGRPLGHIPRGTGGPFVVPVNHVQGQHLTSVLLSSPTVLVLP